MSKFLKDGYIGLIRSPITKNYAPIITQCRVHVQELSDKYGEYRSLTSARFNITNMDVSMYSLSGIQKVKVEIADFDESEEEYSIFTDNMPGKWTVLDTLQLSNLEEGMIGLDNSVTFTCKNIPTARIGYWHKFRLTFMNNNDIPARIIPNYSPEVYDPLPGHSVNIPTVSGTMSNFKFIADVSQNWETSIFEGFSAQFYTINGSALFAQPAPIYKNEYDDIYIQSSLPVNEGLEQSDVVRMEFVETKFYHSMGIDGFGKNFNGIDDLLETVSVLDIAVEITPGNWTTIPFIPTDIPIDLPTDDIKIRWKNMWKHATTLVVNGIGDAVEIPQEMWNNVTKYSIYMVIANDPVLPDTDYLLPSGGNYPKTIDTGLESNGTWYLIESVNDDQYNIDIKPYYETIIPSLPLNKVVGFWVGAETGGTQSVISGMELRPIQMIKES